MRAPSALRKATLPLLCVGAAALASAGAQASDLTPVDEATLQTIATHLGGDGAKGIDFVERSKEYCLNAGLPKGGHMTHWAVDPDATREDIIDFVHAGTLEASGVDLSSLPRHPGKLGTMEPGQWYYVPAGAYEPHHDAELPFPVIVRATNIR